METDELSRVGADIVLVRKRIAKLDKIDAKAELADNVLPLLEGLVAAVRSRMGDLAANVQNLADDIDEIESSEVVHYETTAKIVEVIALGEVIDAELEQLAGKSDDVTKKRVAALVQTYRQGSVLIGQMLAEITIEHPYGEDDAEGEEEPDDEDDEEDEEDEDDEDDDELAAEEGR